ncbi:hypothetical protein HO173_010029 [Letharia columbiana]|uniref:Uncharacterized protein n=1 Tax=Letharia columbiana TaxID=112416 RepID=A0A8H6FNE1_9LECA|nr:uncharacterized protein HO173_010029 [Letharia columbiana]KAF6231727.1 hypothetical protein HO173_010029 [Letharia columbiana]
MPVHRPRTPYFADHSSSESRAELRTLALQPVRLNRGTAYPCTENELRDATTLSSQSQRSYVSAMQASRDVFAHNALGRNLSFEEYDAVIRLENIVLEVVARRREWSPDLIIKAFCDLDLVFFDGFLRGHVYVQWKTASYFPPPLPRSLTFGLTNPLGGGKAVIHLNVDAICWNDSTLATTSTHSV